jgi:TRAP-type mannitol/chloroaromatic compound transport system permease small subunit
LSAIRIFLGVIDFTSDIVGKLVSFLMTIAIGVLITGIVRRYVFNNPWAYETITANFLTAYVMLGAAFALHSGAFVNIDIYQRRMHVRTRAITNMLTHIFFFLFCFAILKEATPEATQALSVFRPSIRLFLNPSRWPVKVFYPIGVALLFLQGLAKFIRDLMAAFTGKETT